MNIEQSDVVKLVLQFLKESNYTLSFEALLRESKVDFNYFPNPDVFSRYVLNGEWDLVLEKIRLFKFPKSKLINLQEKIAYDFLDQDKLAGAKFILNQLQKHQKFDSEFEVQSNRLRQQIESFNNNLHKLSQKTTKEVIQNNRKNILEIILSSAEKFQNGLLLIHLSQSLQFLNLANKNSKSKKSISLFKEKEISLNDQTDANLNSVKVISFASSNSYANTIEISKDGLLYFVGFSDGIIEAFDAFTHEYSKTCLYQKDGFFLRHSSCILALKVNENSKSLASYCVEAVIKIWDIEKGVLVKKINSTTNSSSSSFLEFVRGDSCLSIFTDKIKIFGLNSCKKINEIETKFENKIIKVERIFGEDNFAVLEERSTFLQIFDLKNAILLKKIIFKGIISDFDFFENIFALCKNEIEVINSGWQTQRLLNFSIENEEISKITVCPNGNIINAFSSNFNYVGGVDKNKKEENRAFLIEKKLNGSFLKMIVKNLRKNQVLVLTDSGNLLVLYDLESFQ